jgi:hypothetical protein
MAPINRTKQLRQLIMVPIMTLRAKLTLPISRRVWRFLMLASLLLTGASIFYTWKELPTNGLVIRPVFLVLAVVIYIATYVMHTLGWHTLITQFHTNLSLRTNAEAVASSNLVKYLPTVAWYIASRAHFYNQRHIPHKVTVAASLCELVLMIGAGSIFYLILALEHISIWMALVGIFILVLALASFLHSSDLLRKWWQGRVTAHLTEAKGANSRHRWFIAFVWYASTWILGCWFLWAVLHTFVPLQMNALGTLMHIWLLAGLASYIVNLTLGSIGIAREITLTVLLAHTWPLSAALSTAIVVKLVLTLGEIGCSLLFLGGLYLWRKRVEHD